MVLEKLAFSITWTKWIAGCLANSSASVLVNGSPTQELGIGRGLGQGDLLSPFLFLLAMKGLHAVIKEAEEKRIFLGQKWEPLIWMSPIYSMPMTRFSLGIGEVRISLTWQGFCDVFMLRPV